MFYCNYCVFNFCSEGGIYCKDKPFLFHLKIRTLKDDNESQMLKNSLRDKEAKVNVPKILMFDTIE